MEEKYQPQVLEEKWQKIWKEKGSFKTPAGQERQKYYLLVMFPYPSGRIHMGHVRNYTIGDVLARFKRMKGFDVLHPIGWDAFGMPAENAAIKNNTHPAPWTEQNIATMRTQLARMGFSYDWDREVNTSTPEYYKHEQRFFIEMIEKGLAYQKESLVNWCTDCGTVLANEQVVDGKCWRCDNLVTQKSLKQWFFKITQYADELLNGLETLKGGWPERVLSMQREWIGKSTGATIDFPIEDSSEKITIFTTRPDTIFGTTFMSIACEHPMVSKLISGKEQEADARAFIEKVRTERAQGKYKDDQEKDGVFTGSFCFNPITKRRLPIFLTNFVVMDYGTGAVMAVPAHDQRDFDFAKKFELPMLAVICRPGEIPDVRKLRSAFEEDGILCHSEQFNGMKNSVAKIAITDFLERKKLGKKHTQFRLRDWGVSRQRYWGAPIPVVYCESCGVVPEKIENLPVLLPHDVPFTGKAGSPLLKSEKFLNTACPSCQGKARRETDTMDTFMESSWYFLRYTDPKNTDEPFAKDKANFWMPVDQYVGGIEHAILHLLYSRFFTRVLRDLHYVDVDEPFSKLLTQGMVIKDGFKMSKSKGNVVDPDHLISQYGADTARLFILFASPAEKDLDWSDQGVEGSFRFLNRIWNLFYAVEKNQSPQTNPDPEIEFWTHKTIKKITEDLDQFRFNTAVAALMEFVNFLQKAGPTSYGTPVFNTALKALVRLLFPFVPHLASELASTLSVSTDELETWPEYDGNKLVRDTITIVIQMNGKWKGEVVVNREAGESEITRRALDEEKIKTALEGRVLVKTIYVPGKLLSLVVK